jgi:hypothetical protein
MRMFTGEVVEMVRRHLGGEDLTERAASRLQSVR